MSLTVGRTSLALAITLISGVDPRADHVTGSVSINIAGFSVESDGYAEYLDYCEPWVPAMCTAAPSISGNHRINDGALGSVADTEYGPLLPSYSGYVSAGSIYEHCYRADLSVIGSQGANNRYTTYRVCAPPENNTTRPDATANCPPSPIILSLRGPYELTSAVDGVEFDIRNDGRPVRIGWTREGSLNAFLACDKNGNGIIDDGGELFGNFTRLSNGEVAPHGFIALSEFDDNDDGVVDHNDRGWGGLLLWTDHDHDGVSTPQEMQSIARSPVTRLEYRFVATGRTDAWGNRFQFMSHFTTRTEGGSPARHPYYDVFFSELATAP